MQMRIRLIYMCMWAAGLGLALPAAAAGTYQTPAQFVAETFGGDAPPAQALWLDDDVRGRLEAVLGHAPKMLRLRYWAADGRTVWILDEVGKEQPITTGVVVNEGRIEELRVLVFRESRGWQIRYPFFTDQFKRVRLTEERELSADIDGITGATLSVRAMSRVAKAALTLHGIVTGNDIKLARQP